MHRLPLAGLVFAATSVLPAAAHAAPRWLAPVPPFGDVPARQDDAGAAMAQDGRIVFARVTPDGALQVRERPPGGPLAAPVTIADGAEHLHVLGGADGTAAVLFDEDDERYVALRPPDGAVPVGARAGAAVVAPDGAWDDPDPAGSELGAEAVAPDAASGEPAPVGARGGAAAVARDGAWSDPVPVGPAGSEPGAEAIAPDGELWRVAAAPGDAGRLAVYRRGVATAPQTLLLPPPAVGATDAEPALALPGSGGAHVAYLEQGTTGEDGHCSGKTTVLAADVPRAGAVPRAVLLDSFRADGAGSAESCAFADGRLVSGPPLLVTDAPGADTAVYPVRSFPSLAVAPEARHRDAGGVWPNLAVPAERVADGIPEGLIGGRGRTLAIVGGSVTVRRADGSWSALAPLAGVDGPRAVQAARTGLGTTVTAWVERGTGRIVGRVVDADGVPGDPVLLAPAAPGAMMLAAGGDTEGNGVALFSRPQDDAFVLLASGFDPAAPRRTALEVPSDGIAGEAMTLAAAGLDVWSGPVTDVSWDFGDGTEGNGATVRHVYADAGARVLRMRLRDASGNATDTFVVTEIAPGPEP